MPCLARIDHPVRRGILFVIATLVCVGLLAIRPVLARAGTWVEVSCLNPNQSGAPSEGWTQFASGAPGYGSTGSARCPMFGLLSSAVAEQNGNGENLRYLPPSGSTLIGGSVDASGYAGGGGYNASGTVVAYSPEYVYPGDVIFQCAEGLGTCSPNSFSFSGVISLPANAGGGFYIGAGCGGAPGYSCDEGASNGAWSNVEVHWANFTLSNTSAPSASGFSGALLQPNASGTEDVSFTASDPGGPGVYLVTIQVDGSDLYNATPDNNNGQCVSQGTQGEAEMFDYSQPCKQSEGVDIPVNTGSLPDGSHTLKVIVTDAAKNSATVYNTTITTENAPVVTSSPLVSGTAQVGSTLSGVPGVFEARSGLGPLSAASSQWLRCSSPGNCSAIPGATSTTYTPVAADKGYTIEYENSVEDAHKHKKTATSAPTVAVAEAPGSGGSCAGQEGCQQGGTGGNGGNGGSGGSGSGTTSTTTNNSSTTNNASGESLSAEALAIARGAANGSPVSDQANLSVHWAAGASASSVKVSFVRRSRAVGRLVASDGQPISGAVLQVMADPSSPGLASFLEGTVKTAGDGTFTFDTNAKRPSRTLIFEYKSHANDVSLAAQAQLTVGVPVPISLKISPRSVSKGSTIHMTGSVPSPVPAGGKQIVFQALALGVRGAKWQTFNVVRTTKAGKFKASYRFRFSGPARYRIRAVSRFEQDYPYLANTSASALIKEN